MYVPSVFQVENLLLQHELIEKNPFATLITNIDGEPFATHLPLLLDRTRGDFGTLLGHVAKANPHWQAFREGETSLAIFHGPQAYISPNWYVDPKTAVPTWNYAVVHAYGTVEMKADAEWLTGFLSRMAEVFEQSFETPWNNELPSDLNEKLLHSIIGFELRMTRLEGKFKLGQNRSEEDQRGMQSGLENVGAVEIVELMKSARASKQD